MRRVGSFHVPGAGVVPGVGLFLALVLVLVLVLMLLVLGWDNSTAERIQNGKCLSGYGSPYGDHSLKVAITIPAEEDL